MTYVYILSDYGEYGAENVCATLDRSKLPELLRINFTRDGAVLHKGWLEDALSGLGEQLQKTDEELVGGSGWDLHKGWGGAMLHVVKLYE